jgi:hypothetical protein
MQYIIYLPCITVASLLMCQFHKDRDYFLLQAQSLICRQEIFTKLNEGIVVFKVPLAQRYLVIVAA